MAMCVAFIYRAQRPIRNIKRQLHIYNIAPLYNRTTMFLIVSQGQT